MKKNKISYIIGFIFIIIGFLLFIINFIGLSTGGFGANINPFQMIFSILMIFIGGVFITISGFVDTIKHNKNKALYEKEVEIEKTNINTKSRCPICNSVIDDSNTFCTSCGAKLEKICSCGTKNDYKAKYCKKCGKEL